MLDADVVVMGIGVAPATDWLEGSGLTIDNGIVVDETLLAAPAVIVANDITRPDAGFAVETNAVTIIEAGGSSIELPVMSKERVAAAILDRVAKRLV